MRVGLVQLNVGPDPAANLPVTAARVKEAYAAGADLVCTPEVTGFITTDADHQAAMIRQESDDETLDALRSIAVQAGRWLSIGSLAVDTGDPDGRFANRSFLIAPSGEIAARYDKIHMFDVEVSETEKYRESARYRPGTDAVLAETPYGRIGLSICYDLRFPALYRRLAQAGADILLIPSAFSPVTGAAHWEPLLRARAIETGCFVIAAAQTGEHVGAPKPRATHGHAMIVSPWGEVLCDMGTEPGVACVDLDLSAVAEARRRVPSLSHDRDFGGP